MPKGINLLKVTQEVRLETSILVQNRAPGLLSPRSKSIGGQNYNQDQEKSNRGKKPWKLALFKPEAEDPW